jgi:hypothetical protein
MNETQELKSLLDSADQRNHEQEQVFNLSSFLLFLISFVENYPT